MGERLDVLIVGGGLVGCSLAIALDNGGLTVGLIEAQASNAQSAPPSFDERNLALARASLDTLKSMRVLDKLARAPAPIERIHVSRVGDFGAVRLRAEDYGQTALGGVLMARDLGQALQARLAELPSLQHYCPARVVEIAAESDGWQVEIEQAGHRRLLHTRLLVAADGTTSSVRARLGIDCDRHDYRQTLLVCSLRSSRGVDGSAWERFSATGPVALLPRNDGRLGSICAVDSAQAEQVLALGDADYLDFLQQRFGYRAGRFLEVGKRVAYPLQRVVAQQLVAERAVLVGNAAQTLHPIGAQGFNLGLRDALTLADVIRGQADPGAAASLADYAARRTQDRQQTLAFSHGLAELTRNDGLIAHTLRSLGLLLVDRSHSLRAPLVAAAMGFPRRSQAQPGAVP